MKRRPDHDRPPLLSCNGTNFPQLVGFENEFGSYMELARETAIKDGLIT